MKRVLVAATLLLAGCTVGPDYRKPDMDTPPAYQALPAAKAPPTDGTPVSGNADLSRWWTRFDDAELHRLVERALASNLDLLTLASRMRDARQQEIVAGAAGLPQVNATGAAAHAHLDTDPLSEPGDSPANGAQPLDLKYYSLGFDATWEIDVFGAVRRDVESAAANGEAALWQVRDGEVTLTAEIATDYLTLRAAQARLAILADESLRQGNVLAMISARSRAGFVTRLDVNQQNTLVASTLAQAPELEAQARASEHAIAVLLGEPPEALTAELDAQAAFPAVPDSLPVGLPSDILRRRPDIRVAERKLAAATAQIGVAVADLYPKFDLVAAASFAGSHFSNLLSGSNLGETGLGSVVWPIFHGGRIRANIRSKEEGERQAYYAYRKAVLGALQDCEDALVRAETERRRLVQLEREVAAAGSSANIARAQYRAGTVAYIGVLTAQTTELSARDELAQSKLAFANDLISLYKALGGGWRTQG